MESTIEMDRRNDYDQEESTHCPEVNEINTTNYGNAHQEKDNLIDYNSTHEITQNLELVSDTWCI